VPAVQEGLCRRKECVVCGRAAVAPRRPNRAGNTGFFISILIPCLQTQLHRPESVGAVWYNVYGASSSIPRWRRWKMRQLGLVLRLGRLTATWRIQRRGNARRPTKSNRRYRQISCCWESVEKLSKRDRANQGDEEEGGTAKDEAIYRRQQTASRRSSEEGEGSRGRRRKVGKGRPVKRPHRNIECPKVSAKTGCHLCSLMLGCTERDILSELRGRCQSPALRKQQKPLRGPQFRQERHRPQALWSSDKRKSCSWSTLDQYSYCLF